MSIVIPSSSSDNCVDALHQQSNETLTTNQLDENSSHEDSDIDIDDDNDGILENINDDAENSQTKTEKWHEYKKNKRYVRSYLGQQIAFGSNSLLIKKITGKFISMIETQNGLVHEHRRHDMASTVKYIGYKKSILSRQQSSASGLLDMSKQSAGYHQQLSNVHDMQDEIKYLIDLMHKESHCKLSFNVIFNHDVVQLNLEDSSTINIFFRYDDDNEKLAISHNIDMSNIICEESLQLITFLQKLSILVIDKKSKAGLEFQSYMSTLYWGQLQLDKLANKSEDFDVDDTLKADIVQHIEKSKVGDKLSIILGEHNYNGIIYNRVLIVRKFTKVRTIVELIATASDEVGFFDEIIEYRSTIMKITHNITENTDKILMIHNALK